MTLFLLVLAGSLFLLPAFIIVFAFLAASADYLIGGGSAATRTGSNVEPRREPAGVPSNGLLKID